MVDVAFYGDDFTGSTDALRQFERGGLRSVLLVELPPADELRTLASRYDVIGVAGIARSLGPDEQEAEIRPILTALRDLGPRVVQYKICSTADSSPQLGSLGRALEVGRSIFGTSVIPLMAAQPELGRYTVFGHHFAAESGTVYRLDRQPTMANHPATPMDESDLRVHLAKQTNLRIGSIDLTKYADLVAHYTQVADADVLILDALTDEDLRAVGQAILATDNSQPVFAMGSGGLSRALTLELADTGAAKSSEHARPSGSADGGRVLVVSGSQSRRTAEQIECVVAAGWTVLVLGGGGAIGREAVEALRAGAPGVVVHTGRADGRPAAEALASLASGLAEVVRVVARGTDVRRLVVAGGDTSGRVLRELGLTALELVATSERFGPGLSLCRSIAAEADVDRLEIVLKGGQLGSPDLFERIRIA
jgi:3-oxoisoapionate kinase